MPRTEFHNADEIICAFVCLRSSRKTARQAGFLKWAGNRHAWQMINPSFVSEMLLKATGVQSHRQGQGSSVPTPPSLIRSQPCILNICVCWRRSLIHLQATPPVSHTVDEYWRQFSPPAVGRAVEKGYKSFTMAKYVLSVKPTRMEHQLMRYIVVEFITLHRAV